MISSNLLHIMDLTCRFGGLLAVDNVTTLVSRGEIRALIGPNGAGKSTTLNLITGIYQPDSGSVFLDGKTITGMSPARIARAGIARTFQTIRLWKQMSLLENVMVGHQCRMQSNFFDVLFASKRSRAEEEIVRSKAYAALELVNLSSKAMQLAGSLSYGQQRRLEIARALATDPSVLLLDEPAAGMNTQESNELVEQIFTIRDKGVTVVLIEHNMPLVMRVADQITVLSFGRKIAEGTPAEIKENRDVIAAYLGNADDDAAA